MRLRSIRAIGNNRRSLGSYGSYCDPRAWGSRPIGDWGRRRSRTILADHPIDEETAQPTSGVPRATARPVLG